MSLRGKRSGRPVPEVGDRADALEEALGAGANRLDDGAVRDARRLLAKIDQRLRVSGEHTVVALAGATGSGKSSLFNALAGLEIATVGVRRPTTATATACVWGVDGAQPLLEWLQVPVQHRVSRQSALDSGADPLQGLVLLDLPDHDSTQATHRAEVDRLLELVDVFVWVTDPQKYADAALHHQYLSRLAGHDAVTVVVLNHADTLTAPALEVCRRDLSRLVAADGLRDVEVLTTSAVRGDGVPDLRSVLAQAVARRNAWLDRLAADLDDSVRRVAQGVAVAEPSPDALERGTGLVDALLDAAGARVVVRAVEQDYLRGALAAGGWPVTRWLLRLRPDPLRRLRVGAGQLAADATVSARSGGSDDVTLRRSSLPAATTTQRSRVASATHLVGDRAAEGLPDRWADATRAAAAPDPQDLTDALDQAVIGTDLAGRRPTWWTVLAAVQLLLGVLAVAGLGWLMALGVLGWLRLPQPRTPYLGPLPLPTLALVAGAVLGFLVGLAVRAVARPAARRRGAKVLSTLRARVQQVADRWVLDPVQGVLADHRRTREALDRAA